MFVLELKNPMIGFPKYAGRREGKRIYFEPIEWAKKFSTESEAKEWASNSLNQFNIIPV